MYQFLKFESPIPSCEIHSLSFEDGKWYYTYALNTPFELTNENDRELIIYEYISDLYLRLPDTVHPESVNLRIKTLDEYLEWLEKQRLADISYRMEWKKKHPNAKPNIVKLRNQNYDHDSLLDNGVHYIASMINNDGEFTEFAAI